MRYRGVFLALLTIPVSTCDADSDRDATYVVRDSLGIRIVENLLPAWTDSEVWRVDPDPEFDLSGRTDPELYLPISPYLLNDGRTVLFNSGTCEVRFYDDDGRFLKASGGRGGGPGEYLESAQIFPWWGDSLLVFDYDQLRIAILDGEGELGHTALVPNSGEMPRPIVKGTFADGTLVLSSPRDPVGRLSPGLEEAKLVVGLIRELRDTVNSVGTFPGGVWDYYESFGTRRRKRLAFGGTTEIAVGRQRFFLGFSDRYEIQVMASDGTLETVIRRAFRPVPVTRNDIDLVMERLLAKAEDAEGRRRVRQLFIDLQHAVVMPAFGNPVWPGRPVRRPGMIADATGNLWVMDYYRPGEYANNWCVFSPQGIWLGTVTLPNQFRPTQIGTDYLLGEWFDELNFTHIRRHRLTKP